MNIKSNPWPFAIILTFALFLAGTIGLVVMACTHRTDLVNANYYEQELKFQGQIERVKRTQHLATQATVHYDTTGRRIMLCLPAEQNGKGVTGSIQLYRPSAAKLDRQLALQVDSHGRQSLDASELQPGLWKIRVTWTANNEDYFIDEKVVIKGASS
jgi:nitrogen fixation protein FixH